jgi:hypothetical protein
MRQFIFRLFLALVVGFSIQQVTLPSVHAAGIEGPTRACTEANEGDTDPYDPFPGMFHWECVCRWSGGGTTRTCAWEVVPGPDPGAKRTTGLTYVSSTYGCVTVFAEIASDYYGADWNVGLAAVNSRNYVAGDGCPGSVKYQPAGELRVRPVLQYLSGSSWLTCTAPAYTYNTGSRYTVSSYSNMGSVPDCGATYYRTVAYGYMYDGGLWRGGTITGTSYWMQ